MILPAMTSLDELVAAAGRALSDGRRLFGVSPVNAGGWSSAPALVAGRQGVLAVGGAAAAGWVGVAASTYGRRNASEVRALGNTVVADDRTVPALTNVSHVAASGATSMDNLIAETRAGVAMIARSENSPAGRQELAAYLQEQVARAKAVLQTSQQDSHELAVSIKNGSGGYRRDGVPSAPADGPGTDGDKDRGGADELDNHVRLVDSKGTSDYADQPQVAIDPRNTFIGDQRFGYWLCWLKTLSLQKVDRLWAIGLISSCGDLLQASLMLRRAFHAALA